MITRINSIEYIPRLTAKDIKAADDRQISILVSNWDWIIGFIDDQYDMEDEIERLEQQLADQKEEISDLEDTISDLEYEMSDLEDKNNELESELKKLRGENT